jgi:hypothetical protein
MAGWKAGLWWVNDAAMVLASSWCPWKANMDNLGYPKIILPS